jgi:hypothetical protein
MKRSLIAVAVVLFSTASHAAVGSALSENTTLDRSLPTYPELGLGAAGTLVAEAKYRLDAGQPTQDLAVQDYGSV